MNDKNNLRRYRVHCDVQTRCQPRTRLIALGSYEFALWQVRPAVESACGVYNVSTGIPILNALPTAELVTAPGVDTDVVVDFDADTRTALLSWRGSTSQQDWLQVRTDFRCFVTPV